jgi:hypothetical protein
MVAGDRWPGLDRDIAAMAAWYPQFRLVIPFHGLVHWRGVLKPFQTRLNTFEVALTYGQTLQEVPKIWVLFPEISQRTHSGHLHLNTDGSLCTFFVPDQTYHPMCDDLSRLVDLTGDWLRRAMFYWENGWWPGLEAPHDPADVIRELQGKPGALCVCGGGRAFSLCCEPIYRKMATAIAAGRSSLRHETPSRRISIAKAMGTVRNELGPIAFAQLLPHLGPAACLLPNLLPSS